MNQRALNITFLSVLSSLSFQTSAQSLGGDIERYGWRGQSEQIKQTSKAHRPIEATPDHLVVATPLPNGRFPTDYPMEGNIGFQITFVKKAGKPEFVHVELDCKEMKLFLSSPDEKGVFRHVAWNEPAKPPFDALCRIDFSAERRAAEADIRKVSGLKDLK